jgi:hypothetical protein
VWFQLDTITVHESTRKHDFRNKSLLDTPTEPNDGKDYDYYPIKNSPKVKKILKTHLLSSDGIECSGSSGSTLHCQGSVPDQPKNYGCRGTHTLYLHSQNGPARNMGRAYCSITMLKATYQDAWMSSQSQNTILAKLKQ